MIDKLEIHHLKTLDALYRFENLTEAAEFLEVSQQAISLKLKKMREILGDSLFVRTGHGVAATPYAKAIEPLVYKVLASFNEIQLPNALQTETLEKTLVISATDYTQQIIIGDLIQALQTHWPKVSVVVVNIQSANLTKKMQQGEIDLVFTSHGYVPEGLIAQPLFTENYLCVTANKKLASKKSVTLPELVEYPFIVTSPGVGSLRGSADAWFEKQGLTRKIALSVPTFFMAQEYLRKTDLLAFLPSRLAPFEGLFAVPLEQAPPGYEVVLAYHPRAENDPLVSFVLKHLAGRYSR